MNIVSIDSITKEFGEKRLFDAISFGIEDTDRIGLIGVNGTGKSTLLKMIAGQVEQDRGQIIFRSGVRVEYLSQVPDLNPEDTVLEAIFHGDSPAIRLVRAYEETLDALTRLPDDKALQSKLAGLQEQMEAQGAWALESEAKGILGRLGITRTDAKVGTLSGGQKKRVALARALIQPADLLLLDEPTNHIDNDTVAWLESYLTKFPGALVLITHDRYFLDRVVNRIMELDRARLYSYEGNYATYLEAKAERQVTASVQEERRNNLLRREIAWLRQGAKARQTKQKARKERIAALLSEEKERSDGQVEIAIGTHRLGKRILELKDVTKSIGGERLIDGFTYTVLPGDRIGIVGPNGSGKSTLLNLIAGRLEPDAGEIVRGQTVRLGYYRQENEELDPAQKVIDYIKDVAEVVHTPDGGYITASQMLERFLFHPKVQHTEIGKLSGGERRRLYLLRVLMGEPNVLLLDEPTNDLDVQTLTILEEYLEQFAGVVITVSHDRYFLDKVVDHLFAFEDGRIRSVIGDYSDYLEARQAEKAEAPAPTAPVKEEKGGRPDRQPALKLSFKEQKEWESIEQVIADLEAEVEKVAKAMEAAATDHLRLQELSVKHQQLEQELAAKFDRWAELTEKVEQIEAAKKR